MHNLIARCEKLACAEHTIWQTRLHQFEQDLPHAKNQERLLQRWCSVVSKACAPPPVTATVDGVRRALASLADAIEGPWDGDDAANNRINFSDFEVNNQWVGECVVWWRWWCVRDGSVFEVVILAKALIKV